MVNALFMVFLPVLMVCVFSFITIAACSDARRREREAFYRSETIKRMTEAQGGADGVLRVIQEEERIGRRKRRDDLKLTGPLTVAAGVGLMIFLHGVVKEDGVYLVGAIPALVGLASMVHAYLILPRN